MLAKHAVVPISLVAIATVASGVLGFEGGKNAIPVAHASSVGVTPQSIATVVASAPFHVALPTVDSVQKSSAHVNYLWQGGPEQIEVDYLLKNDISLSIQEMRGTIKHISSNPKYPILDLTLPNGLQAQFQDTGVCKMISWNSDGMGYQVFAEDISNQVNGEKLGTSRTIDMKWLENLVDSIK